jgi:hypothetical protein
MEIDGSASGSDGSSEMLDISDQMPEAEPVDPESPMFFDPVLICLGKTFREVKEMCPDLEYRGPLTGSDIFYYEEKDLDLCFNISDINDPDNPNVEAVVRAVILKAEAAFPNISNLIAKKEIEKSTGMEFCVANENKNAEISYGDYVGCFQYQNYEFLYWPDDLEGDISPETMLLVKQLCRSQLPCPAEALIYISRPAA